MSNKVFLFDSHPVQYKAPVYQAMAQMIPECFEVIFATDSSARAGYRDEGFGKDIAWDTPLLTGYPHRILGNQAKKGVCGLGDLSGRGVFRLLAKERPKAILLTDNSCAFDRVAYLSALVLGIPIMIRYETQDEAFSRGVLKNFWRDLAYRIMYFPIKHAFAIGALNLQHLIRHGVAKTKISLTRYSAPNPIASMDMDERSFLRKDLRERFDIGERQVVVSFFGKMIPKKNPDLLFQSVEYIPQELRERMRFLFVGSGPLGEDLFRMARQCEQESGIKTTFAGFVNQTHLAPYYLASDIVVLPSRKRGETWGLVINEALQAGCAVVVTDAVGCHPEFRDLERVRVIPCGSKKELALSFGELSLLPRDFFWAEKRMKNYSTENAAKEIATKIRTFCNTEKQNCSSE